MKNRSWLGNTRAKGADLQLKDAAEIQMLDEQGRISKSITPGSVD